jgi:hypothetical protein
MGYGIWNFLRTVSDIALLDLLQDLGPYVRVAFFVGFDGGGLQMDDLRDAADWCHFAG